MTTTYAIPAISVCDTALQSVELHSLIEIGRIAMLAKVNIHFINVNTEYFLMKFFVEGKIKRIAELGGKDELGRRA